MLHSCRIWSYCNEEHPVCNYCSSQPSGWDKNREIDFCVTETSLTTKQVWVPQSLRAKVHYHNLTQWTCYIGNTHYYDLQSNCEDLLLFTLKTRILARQVYFLAFTAHSMQTVNNYCVIRAWVSDLNSGLMKVLGTSTSIHWSILTC